MAEFTVRNGSNVGLIGDDTFNVTTPVGVFDVDGGEGIDHLIADISNLQAAWSAENIERYTFSGARDNVFQFSFGDAAVVDLSAVTSRAVVELSDDSVKVTGGGQTIIGVEEGFANGATSQTMNLNTGVLTLAFADGTAQVMTDGVQGFEATNGVASTTIGNERANVFAAIYGDHFFSGAGGIDTIALAYQDAGLDPNDYSIFFDSLGNVLINAGAGPSEIEIEGSSVERVEFIDTGLNTVQTLALDVRAGENAGLTYRIYQAAFDRAPDAPGLAFWLNHVDDGLSLEQMARFFVTSEEFIATYGADTSNAEFIDLMYQNILGREGEEAGVVFWNGVLDGGSATRAQVLAGFSESEENIQGVAASIEDGFYF